MRIFGGLILVLISPIFVFAHCPLCTAGAGIGALIAKELGMKSSAIGVWLGAFAIALGWWVGNMISKRFGSHMLPEYKPNNLHESKPNGGLPESKPNNLPECQPNNNLSEYRPNNMPESKPNSLGANSGNTFVTNSGSQFDPNLGSQFSNNSGNIFGSNSGDIFDNNSGNNNSVKIRAVNSVIIRVIYNFLTPLSILISFLSIILPLKLYFYETGSFYLYLFGDYGSLFNRTYVYDKFLFGSVIGGLIILISPLISKKIIQLRKGEIFPYQGLLITFILLMVISVLFQVK